jgi:uncharacterized protein (TIGR02001 family)
MKKSLQSVSLITLSAMSVFVLTPVKAVEGLSANAGVTSNYLWRGLEQTAGKSAVSGGIDYSSNSGFYVGTWISNADWATDMTYELDFYGGFSSELNDVGFDFGFVHYAYLDSTDNVDFTEVNASISFNVFSLSYAVLTDAEGVDFGDDSYISAGVDLELESGISFNLHIGTGTDEFYAGESFIDYGASIGKNGFILGLSKTDLDQDDIKMYVSYSIDIDL